MKVKIIFLSLYLACASQAICQIRHNKEQYEIKQDSVWIETSNGQIFGLLFQPIGTDESKTPAILCLQGGGDVGLDNYTYEARFFAKNGIASLVCDKSGAGLSQTEKSWAQQSFKEKTAEYLELHTWLSNYNGIDENKVGVHGMSEGGRLALNMVIKNPNKIAFVNAVSGPTASYKENQLYAIYNHLHSQNNTDSITINKAIKVWDMYFEDVSKGKISGKTLKAINELIEVAPNLRYRPDTSGVLPSRPLPEDIHFTMEGSIENINCPVLLQYGELDTRVDPKKSLTVIPNKSNFVIKNYADTDHSMNLKNGNMNPLFIEDKLNWIQNSVLNKE